MRNKMRNKEKEREEKLPARHNTGVGGSEDKGISECGVRGSGVEWLKW